MKEKKTVEEFLQQNDVFPIVQGLVVGVDPCTGAEVETEEFLTGAECPFTEMEGLNEGDDGLFFVESRSDNGKAILSYKRAVEFEALYNAAIHNEVHYVRIGSFTEPDLVDRFGGARASFSEGVFRDVIAWVPAWAATGVDLSNHREKMVVSVLGISFKGERVVALLSRDRAKGIVSFGHDSASTTPNPEELKQYQAFLKKGNFVMGRVQDFSEQGAIIEFEFGINGLLSLEELQEGAELELNQPVGVLIKESSKATGLHLTRRPLTVLNQSLWE
jgi:hypothetical protein